MSIPPLYIGDLATLTANQINQCITKLEVSYTLDLVSEIAFDVVDKDMFLWNRNSFLIRRDVRYLDQFYEMSNISITQQQGFSPVVSVKARKKALQRMKRDKSPESYGGTTATQFAAEVAARYGLKFVGEPTSKRKVTGKSSSSSSDESVYDVLKRNANEANFVVFESDDTLYFASEQWLLGKWANISLTWPNFSGDTFFAKASPFWTLGMPACEKSDDDPYAASFKAIVNRQNGTELRPGMTVNLSGINGFDGAYLISEVAYSEGNNSPVSISCRTPAKPRES